MKKVVARSARCLLLLGPILLGSAPAPTRANAADAREKRRFEITASRYQFDPARIEVRRGEVVDLVLHSADTDHGMAIKAYGVKVAIPKSGEKVAVSFVATRAGTFPFECSEYCGSGHKRMKGELVVKEAAQ